MPASDYETITLPDPSKIPPPPQFGPTNTKATDFETITLPQSSQPIAPQVDPNAITPKKKNPSPGIPGVAGSGLINSLLNNTPQQDIEGVVSSLPVLGSILGSMAEPGAGTALGGAAGAFARQALSPNPSRSQLGMDLATNSLIPGGLESGIGKKLAGKLAAKMVSTNNPTVSKAIGEKVAGMMTSPSINLENMQSLASETPTPTTSLEDLQAAEKTVGKSQANLDKLKPQQPADILALQKKYQVLAKSSKTPVPEDDLIDALQSHLEDLQGNPTPEDHLIQPLQNNLVQLQSKLNGLKGTKLPKPMMVSQTQDIQNQIDTIQNQIKDLQTQKVANLKNTTNTIQGQLKDLQTQRLNTVGSKLYSSDLSDAETTHQTNVANHNQLLQNYAPPGQTSVLDDFNKGKTPQQVATKLVSDPREVQKLNLATGSPEMTENLALTHAVGKGYNSVTKTLDPDAILKEIGGDNTEGYSAALSPTTKDNLTNFLTTVKSLQPGKGAGAMMNYTKHRLLWDVGTLGLGGVTSGLHGIAAGGSIIVGAEVINALMKSKTLGNLATQALKLTPDSPISSLVTKTLLGGLKSVPLFYTTDNGKTQTPVTVGQDGSLIPIKSSN